MRLLLPESEVTAEEKREIHRLKVVAVKEAKIEIYRLLKEESKKDNYITYRNIVSFLFLLHGGTPSTVLYSASIEHIEKKKNINVRNQEEEYYAIKDRMFPIEKSTLSYFRNFCMTRETKRLFFHYAGDEENSNDARAHFTWFTEMILVRSGMLKAACALLNINISLRVLLRKKDKHNSLSFHSLIDFYDPMSLLPKEELVDFYKVLEFSLHKEEFEYTDYIHVCTSCHEEKKISAIGIRGRERLLAARDGRCLSCVDKKREKTIEASEKKDEKKRISLIAARRKARESKAGKKKNRSEEYHMPANFICEACDALVESKRGYIKNRNGDGRKLLCGECKKKEIESRRFYGGLSEANREINLTKIRVFGQGKYEHVNIKKTNVTNRRWTSTHAANISRIGEEEEEITPVEKIATAFDKNLSFEVDKLINSRDGAILGITEASREEVIFAATQMHDINPALSPFKCLVDIVYA